MNSKACKSYPSVWWRVPPTCDWWPVPKDGLVPCFCRGGCFSCIETGEGFCCLISILLFRLKSFNCHELWKSVWTQSFNSHFCSQAGLLSAAPCHAFPSFKMQKVWNGLCKRFFFPRCSVPPYFVSGLTSLDKTSHSQIAIWLFRVIQVKIQKSRPPLQFLVPSPGAQAETWRGAEQHHHSPHATVAQLSRRNLRCLLPAFAKWSCSRWQISWQIVWTHLQSHMSPSELYFQCILWRKCSDQSLALSFPSNPVLPVSSNQYFLHLHFGWCWLTKLTGARISPSGAELYQFSIESGTAFCQLTSLWFFCPQKALRSCQKGNW